MSNGVMTSEEKLFQALGFFKDWSNFMLVTSSAALGWVAKTGTGLVAKDAIVICLGLSVMFAVFTLGLIPLVAEKIEPKTNSIYEVKAEFRLLWLWSGIKVSLPLKAVCWPQHVLFIAGILIYAFS